MTTSAETSKLQLEPFKVACSSCNLRELCLPVGLTRENLDRLDTLVATRRTVGRGDTLFRAGDEFQSLYAVRTGFFKTCVSSEDGRDQVTGFQMAGELLGLDGVPNAGDGFMVVPDERRAREVAQFREQKQRLSRHGRQPLWLPY